MSSIEQPGFKVNGRVYQIPTDLSLGEMCDAEREFGVEFGNQQTSSVRMLAALLWLAIRRVDDSVSADDIRDMPADVFADLDGIGDEAASPPAGGAEPNETPDGSGASSSNGSADLDNVPAPIGHPA